MVKSKRELYRYVDDNKPLSDWLEEIAELRHQPRTSRRAVPKATHFDSGLQIPEQLNLLAALSRTDSAIFLLRRDRTTGLIKKAASPGHLPGTTWATDGSFVHP